jgi:ABC-type glycerol-3-phosphate transport system permease component
MKIGRTEKIVSYVILFTVIVYCVVPIGWMLVTSFKTEGEIYQRPPTLLPDEPTLQNYVTVIARGQEFPTYFKNSVIVSVFSVGISVTLAAFAGYGLARLPFPGSGLVLAVLVLILGLPYGVYIIPMFLMFFEVGLLNTYPALILPYVALNLPWGILILRASFRAIPQHIEDAARVDGCGNLRIFRSIMVPMIKPGLVTAALWIFLHVWGELLLVMTLTETGDMKTISWGLLTLRDESQAFAYGDLAPAIIISIAPVIMLFLSLQGYYVKGVSEGSFR